MNTEFKAINLQLLFLTSFLLCSFATIAHAKAKSVNSNKSRKRKIAKSTLPRIEFDLSHSINTNINYQTNPNKEVSLQTIGAKTKFKNKLSKKAIIINLPSTSLEYTGSEDKKIRSFTASNTFIGVYFLNKKNILTPVATASYYQGETVNEDNEIEASKYLSADTELGLTHNFSKKNSLSASLGAKAQNYLEPSNQTDDFERDNLKFSAKVSAKHKITKRSYVKSELKADQTLYKEERSLNKIGSGDLSSSKTIQRFKLKNEIGFNIGSVYVELEASYNDVRDIVSGGDSYRGAGFGAKSNYSIGKNLSLTHSGDFKQKAFVNQLKDPFQVGGTLDNEKFELNLYRLDNEISYKFESYPASIYFGHTYLKTTSNRSTDEFRAQVFKTGLKITI